VLRQPAARVICRRHGCAQRCRVLTRSP
jgi:hypothetical protein